MTEVRFGGVRATSISILSVTQLVAVVPPQAVSGPIQISNGSGIAESSQPFFIGALTDLVLAQSQSTNAPLESQVMSYTLVLTNRGPSLATVVTLTDDLPSNAFPLSVVTSQGSAVIRGSRVQVDVGETLPSPRPCT